MKIKKHFPALILPKKTAYFNNAATTQKPCAMIQARSKFWSKNINCLNNEIKIKELLLRKNFYCKRKISKLFSCRPDEVFFFPQGSTSVLNYLAQELKRIMVEKKLDLQIITSELEHHSNFLPWITNFEKVYVAPYEINNQSINFTDTKWNDSFALSVSGYSNVLGNLWGNKFIDLHKILKVAKYNGLFTIIDGAQLGISSSFNFKKACADFLVFSAHKIFGPTNLGVLIAKKSVHCLFKEQLNSFENSVSWEILEFTESLKFISQKKIMRPSSLQKRIFHQLLNFLKTINDVKIISHYEFESNKNGKIITFSMNEIHSHDFVDLMSSHGIILRGGDLCAKPLLTKLGGGSLIRISISAYNDLSDVLKFKKAFIEVLEFLKNNGAQV